MKRPTSSQIRAFNEVAATGSFSAAARALGLSQPAITSQIKALEEGFSVRLFERTASGSELTTLGHRLFQRTAAQREVERDAAEILLTARALEVGELSIAAGAPGPAMEQVARFRQRYPGIKIDISFGNWQEVVTAIRERRADLGILTAAPSGSACFARHCSISHWWRWCRRRILLPNAPACDWRISPGRHCCFAAVARRRNANSTPHSKREVSV